MSKVSVIIPNYNREDLVLDAMDSVLGQDHRPIQLIVVDDGSTDHSVANIQQWFSTNASSDFECLLVQQKNQGGNVARNTGIKNAKADYVAFLDSDDLWHEDKLKKQLALFNVDPALGAVYCGLEHIRAEDGSVIQKEERNYATGDLSERLLVSDCTAPTSCYLIRREVFDKVGLFDEELQARQDWDMWIRISTEYKISAVKEHLVSYRHHAGERTASDPSKEILAYSRIRDKYLDRYMNLDPRTFKQADSTYHKRMGRVHFHQNLGLGKALRHYFKAITLYPADFDAWAALVGVFIPKFIRQGLHKVWNKAMGRSKFNIRSH